MDALALSALAALLIATAIGIIPALRMARLTPSQPDLRVPLAALGGLGTSRATIRSIGFAAFEAAFALVLVTLALILGSNVYRAGAASLGYDRNHVLTMNLFQQQSLTASPPGGQLYYKNLAARLQSLPGHTAYYISVEATLAPRASISSVAPVGSTGAGSATWSCAPRGTGVTIRLQLCPQTMEPVPAITRMPSAPAVARRTSTRHRS